MINKCDKRLALKYLKNFKDSLDRASPYLNVDYHRINYTFDRAFSSIRKMSNKKFKEDYC